MRISASQPLVALPSQSAKRVASVHRSAHAPASQRASPFVPAGHAFPQRPQLRGSLCVSTHTPLHTAPEQASAVHVARPSTSEHCGVGAAHRVEHDPQRSGVVSEVSQPLEASPSQSPKPGRHAKPQALIAHVAIALAGAAHA